MLSEANPMSQQKLEIKAGRGLAVNVDSYSHVLIHYPLTYDSKQQLSEIQTFYNIEERQTDPPSQPILHQLMPT